MRQLEESQQLQRGRPDGPGSRLVRATAGADDTAKQRREVIPVRLDRRAAADAFAQLGPVAERIEQPDVEHHQDKAGVARLGQLAEAQYKCVEDSSVLGSILREQVDDLSEVVGVRRPFQVFTNLAEGFERVHL